MGRLGAFDLPDSGRSLLLGEGTEDDPYGFARATIVDCNQEFFDDSDRCKKMNRVALISL